MTSIKLRDYQAEAVDKVFSAWREGVRSPAIVLPTGAGKTVVFSAVVDHWRYAQSEAHRMELPGYVGERVIVLVHRDELADQAIRKLREMLPADVRVGKVKASQNETTADVMVCSVQTLSVPSRLNDLLYGEVEHGKVGLIITDECHHAAAPSYRKIYARFPDARMLGVTATMARGDGNGLGDVWDEVVFTRSVLWMISKGYLTDVKAHQVKMDFDLSGVKRSAGDYQAGDLGRAMEAAHADQAIARAYTEHAKDRQGVVFTPTVATAHDAADALTDAGIRTAVITGETPTDDRRRIFEDFRLGKIQTLANCMVLTEGFDAPWAEVAVIARPTQSNPLYIQMVGRVLRPWPGKKDALVLDMVGAASVNKLCTLVDLEETVRMVRDGETIAEAVEREAEEAPEPPRPGTLAWDVKHRHVDLFAGSATAWNTTPKGVPFIECGEATVFLWPAKAGGYSVCIATKGRKGWQRTEHQGLDMGMAMAWGEAVASETGSFSTQKSARWRKSAPSDAQQNLARRLGMDPTGLNRGELSLLIGQHFAARQFDRLVDKGVYC
jgi:superfamily II DNA or RNA helicase